MRGKKTTATDSVKIISNLLKKHNITDTSYGIIISVKNRRDHRTTVKHSSDKGCHLLSVTSKLYKQEFRIYDDVSKSVILKILNENLGEQFRIL